MARRTRSIREMREMYDAAEARGLVGAEEKARKPREETSRERPSRAKSQPRLKVVWNVCDIGGRTVATFDYPQKAEAEAHAAELKAKSKGDLFFVRSEKVPMD